ncbi:hypothetical protein [uncultured Cohaesibacter sp.]|uniref:hypothetical protein n=1 Tax=uncultured Cohaesibacter sp. TaxID=1002546 RepID=UPI0029C66D71|nr:hypothetical protein [uncultured Cohaesibacter sp.]
MLLLRAFSATLAGFWRLTIGIILGTMLYIYCFLYEEKLYTQIHLATRNAVDWLEQLPYIMDYAKWYELLKIDDKLAFALYVLFARLVWMFFESIITFLYRKAR